MIVKHWPPTALLFAQVFRAGLWQAVLALGCASLLVLVGYLGAGSEVLALVQSPALTAFVLQAVGLGFVGSLLLATGFQQSPGAARWLDACSTVQAAVHVGLALVWLVPSGNMMLACALWARGAAAAVAWGAQLGA